jgi:hypothetical protein
MFNRPVEKNEVMIKDRFLFFPILGISIFLAIAIITITIFIIIFDNIFLKIFSSLTVVVSVFTIFQVKKDNIYSLGNLGTRFPLIRKSKLLITSNQITVEIQDSIHFFVKWSELDNVEIIISKHVNPRIVRLLKIYGTELSINFFGSESIKSLKLNSRRFRKKKLHKITKLLI